MNNREECWRDKVWFICQKQHFLFDEYKKSGYLIFDPFIGCNKVLPRLFRILHFKSKLPFKQLWFRKLPKEAPEIVVIREGIVTDEYLRWLRARLPKTKIIGLFMNKLRSTDELNLLRKYNCHPSTGDPNDCLKYGISNRYSAVYLREFVIPTVKKEIDVFYIGKAKKGREEDLEKVVALLKNQGLTVETYLTSPYPYGLTLGKYRKQVSYSDVLKKISPSRAILHLSRGASNGITFRVMESVINHIKLITDDISIMDTEVYKKNNIFILGVDDINTIHEFLEKPFEAVSNEFVEKFYFDTDIRQYLEKRG